MGHSFQKISGSKYLHELQGQIHGNGCCREYLGDTRQPQLGIPVPATSHRQPCCTVSTGKGVLKSLQN